jgi:hypothetical protein
VLAHGPPTAYMFNSQWQQRHVLYVGTDNLVHELYWEPGADWHHGALTNAATAQANGIPTGFAFGAEGRQFTIVGPTVISTSSRGTTRRGVIST